MRILVHVAQKIVNEVTKVIDEEVIVINRKGHIIAASDEDRIGSFHEGGIRVIQSEQKLIIDEQKVNELQGVKVGLNLPIRFQKKVIGVIGITGAEKATTLHGELVLRLTELIIEEAYAAERLDSKLRGVETFVYEWLHTETWTEDIKTRGEILGIHMDEPFICIVIEIEMGGDVVIEPGVKLDIFEMIRAIFPNEEQDVLVRWGRDQFVLLVSGNYYSRKRLDHLLHTLLQRVNEKHSLSLRIGISLSRDQSSHMHLAYKEAKQALAVMEPKEKIIYYEDFTLELALTEIKEETKKKIVSKVLGPIEDDQELLETLRAYFDYEQSSKKAAAALHIHINTLYYRLRRIEQLTNLQLKETRDLVTLYIALHYYWKLS